MPILLTTIQSVSDGINIICSVSPRDPFPGVAAVNSTACQMSGCGFYRQAGLITITSMPKAEFFHTAEWVQMSKNIEITKICAFFFY